MQDFKTKTAAYTELLSHEDVVYEKLVYDKDLAYEYLTAYCTGSTDSESR